MPDYSFEENYVKVEIVGNIIDEKFARVVMKNNDLSLIEIMALDKVQKRKYISDDEIKLLKERNLIEGRKPNFYISAEITKNTEDTKLMASYIRNRAFDDDLYKQQILAYLDQYGKANRSQIQELIGKHLPDILTEDKKYNKVKNILQSMRTAGIINVDKDKNWYKV
jgi:ATP-dependent DNA helicase RecG